MTSNAMEWLNQNRHRAYPMQRDAWREVVPAESGLDCVLLDALVFDSDPSGITGLVFEELEVGEEETVASFKYGDFAFSVTLTGGEGSGEGSYESIRGTIGPHDGKATMTMSFSSHAFIKDKVGAGRWTLRRPVLGSRVLCVSDGCGVDCISTNGSEGVEGRDEPSEAHGDVVLEDGYRTSPIILGGGVFVRVGKRFGLDPCRFDYGAAGSRDCRKPLFFFCGQNAVNSGNVVLKGGRGISVTQGRKYAVRSGSQAGKAIPCIEITAGRELLDMYKPRT